MVSPTDPETRTQYEHALYSPREIDPCAKVRVKNFLAAVGRRAEEVFFIQRIEAEDNCGQSICRCALNLPVPRRYGDRIALGEAVDPKDAENLAAMHAELILDTLGIPLYTDGILQRRHAELCMKNGRYAPVDESSNISPSTKSPHLFVERRLGPFTGKIRPKDALLYPSPSQKTQKRLHYFPKRKKQNR
ncbi:hypothetical protein TcBrA4_0124580 [Trypanosoma cruzi]|nr:hypothetical protein TcBrA4_0124580 [Trypanosoma cruzi]